MSRPPGRHPVAGVASLFLLALLCIGAAELAAARVEAPEVYESVVSPFRTAGQIAGSTASHAYGAARTRLEEYLRQLEAKKEEKRRQKAELERRLALERAAMEAAAQVASAPTIRESMPIADPTITELIRRDGQEHLTGGNVDLIYYNQGDEAWADKRFGSDPISRFGCGPTVMAMAVSSLTGETVTPEDTGRWCGGAGYCAPGSGAYLSIVGGTAEHYGLSCTPLGVPDADTLYETLSTGGLIVALMGPGHFTGGGHFILLHGVTLTGGILTADPNSRENSLTVWEAQTIIDELSDSRHNGAPLWLLTDPLSL